MSLFDPFQPFQGRGLEERMEGRKGVQGNTVYEETALEEGTARSLRNGFILIHRMMFDEFIDSSNEGKLMTSWTVEFERKNNRNQRAVRSNWCHL